MILRLKGDLHIVMEAYLPVLEFFKSKNIFVAVINPFEMKKYARIGLRRIKTDNQDSITIANYGIDNWFQIKNHQRSTKSYSELKFLGKQYCYYTELHVKALLKLTHWNESNDRDELSDFVERY